MEVFKKETFPVSSQSRVKLTSVKMLKLVIVTCLLIVSSATPDDTMQKNSNKEFLRTQTRPLSPSSSNNPGNFNGHFHRDPSLTKEIENGKLFGLSKARNSSRNGFRQRISRNPSRLASDEISSSLKPVLGINRKNAVIKQNIKKLQVAEGVRKENGIQIGPPGAVLERGRNAFSHRLGRQAEFLDVNESNFQTKSSRRPQSQIFLRNSQDRKENARMARISESLLDGQYRQEQLDSPSGSGKERPLRQVTGGFSGLPGSFSPIGNLGTTSLGAGFGDPFRGNIGNFGATNFGVGFGDPTRGNIGNFGASNLGAGFADPLRGNVGNLGTLGIGFGDQFRGNIGNFGVGFGDPLRGNVGNLGTGFVDPIRGNVGNFGTLSLGAGLGAPLSGNVGNLGAPVGAGFVDPIRGNVGNLGALSFGAGVGDPLRGNFGNLGASTLGTGFIDPIRGNVGNFGISALGVGLGDARLGSFGAINAAPFGTSLGGFVDPLRANAGLSSGIFGLGAANLNGITSAGIGDPLIGNIGAAFFNRPLVSGVGGLPIGGLPGGLLGRGPIIDPFVGRLPIGNRVGLSLRGRDDSSGLILDNFGRLTFGDRPGPSDILDQTPLGPIIEEKPLSKESSFRPTSTATTSGRGSGNFQRSGSFVLSR